MTGLDINRPLKEGGGESGLIGDILLVKLAVKIISSKTPGLKWVIGLL